MAVGAPESSKALVRVAFGIIRNMKRVIVVLSLLVVFAVVLLIAWLRSDPDAPRFKPAQTQPVFKSDTLVSYHRLSSRPF